MAFFSWSTTAATNASADSTINWAEGQAPSSINDSARATMARLREWGNDIAGAITTGGTSTAYTVTSNQVFDTLAHLNGQMIAFVPNATSTNAVGVDVTLNVDGLGAKSIRMQPSVALPTGTLVQGTPYIAVYNNSDGVFYLHNTTNPYTIPLGGMIDFAGTTAPNSSFVLPFGQAISRTTYATLFSAIGTTFGTGDGSTTFNIPDLRGRVAVGKDDMGGSAASRVTNAVSGIAGTTLGSSGGSQSHTLTLGELPTGITVTGTVNSTQTNVATAAGGFQQIAAPTAGTADQIFSGTLASAVQISSTGTLTSNNTSGNAHAIMPPTLILNKLLRII